jgi:nucleoside 2-deoxyribosyltransferase
MAESRSLGPKLSAWLREQAVLGRDPPEIDSRNIDTIESSLPSYTVLQKQLILLRALARMSSFPGEQVTLHSWLDYPLAWAANAGELEFYLRTLEARGLVRHINNTHMAGGLQSVLEVASDGWAFLDQNASASPLSEQVFVAMSFADELRNIWEDGIRPAITDAGYRPYRVDAEPHIDRIDAKIVAEIRNSKFLVADVRQHKHGVYFEAGYALGLGIPVIWTVQESDLANTHFDTRQYNHIVWQTPSDLREKLYLVVCAVIGKNK